MKMTYMAIHKTEIKTSQTLEEIYLLSHDFNPILELINENSNSLQSAEKECYDHTRY